MCCVSLFCMGYTRPHTGQGKELSFGVWEGIMRGQRERRGQSRELSPDPLPLSAVQGPSQAKAPHSPDLASSFWERRNQVSPKPPHSCPISVQTIPLVPHALSSEPMESQRVFPGENAKIPQETRSVLVKQGHGLPPSSHRTHFCTTGSKKPHRKKPWRTGFNLVTRILAGYTIPSFSRNL